MSGIVSRPMSRRDVIRLMAAGTGLGLMGTRSGAALALGQPGGWHTAASRTKPEFMKGAVIRTAVKDMAPEELSSRSVLIHEHLGGQFAPTPSPPAGARIGRSKI